MFLENEKISQNYIKNYENIKSEFKKALQIFQKIHEF